LESQVVSSKSNDMRKPQTTPFDFITDEVWSELSKGQQRTEFCDDFDVNLDEDLKKTSEFDFIKGYEMTMEYLEAGFLNFSFNEKQTVYMDLIDGRQTKTNVFKDKVGQIYVCIGHYYQDYCIRLLGSNNGIFVKESEFQKLLEKAKSDFDEMTIAKALKQIKAKNRQVRVYNNSGTYQFYN
jgi:hypothetical protein